MGRPGNTPPQRWTSRPQEDGTLGLQGWCLTSPFKSLSAGMLKSSRGCGRVGEGVERLGIKKAVEDFCRSCPDCQQVAPRPHLRSPLIPLPIISVPFSWIAMDLVGPLPRSSRGHQYILVILDYATWYPEAIPLRTMATKGIARELMMLYGRRSRGLLDLAKEAWEHQPSPHRTMVEHVEEVRERMATIWPMVREHMARGPTQRVHPRRESVGPGAHLRV